MFNCRVTAKLQPGIALCYEGLVMKPIRRREFVRLTAATAMAAAISPARVLALGDSPKRSLRKAVNLGMVKIQGTVLEKFKLLKDLGFDGVELDRPGGPA